MSGHQGRASAHQACTADASATCNTLTTQGSGSEAASSNAAWFATQLVINHARGLTTGFPKHRERQRRAALRRARRRAAAQSVDMRRATRLLAVLHKSAARASPAEQRRLAQLVIDTCAQPSVQQRVADVALQLAERALLRGICAIFDTQPEGMPVTVRGRR